MTTVAGGQHAMHSGWAFLVVNALISLGVFLNGWRFARMTTNPWRAQTFLGLPVQGHDLPIARVRLFGKISMVFAPPYFLLAAALSFGLFGPVDGIETINLGG